MDPHALDDAFLQRVDELCQPGDVVEFVECELGDQPCLFGEPRRDRITVLGIDQRFEVGRADRVELVDTPLHAVDRRSALFDERFSPLDEQLQLARYRIVLDHWQIGFESVEELADRYFVSPQKSPDFVDEEDINASEA